MKLAALVLAFSALAAKGQDFNILNVPCDTAQVELQLQRAGDYSDASVWVGLVGGVLTVAAAQQAARQAPPGTNLGQIAVGFGTFTILGIHALQSKSRRHSARARAMLHQ